MTTDDRIPFRPVLSAFLGIVAPLLCIAVQFSLFPELINDLPGLNLLNTYPFLNYGVVVLEILTLVIWLALGDRVGRWAGVIAGILLAGSLFAGLLGLVLLPFSLIGLLAGIGVLGLVPLGTAFVFFRNGRCAFLLARTRIGYRPALVSLLLGALLVFCVPGVIQARVSRVVRTAIQGINVGAPDATAGLRGLPPFVYRDRLVWAYQREQDPERRVRLARAYAELCGEEIESRLLRLVD